LAEQAALVRRCGSWTGTNLELVSEAS